MGGSMLEAGCVWLIKDHRFPGQQHGQPKYVVLLNTMMDSDQETIAARFATTNGAWYERKFLPGSPPPYPCWTPKADCFQIPQPEKDEPFSKPTWIQFSNPPPWRTWADFADLVKRARATFVGRLKPERTRSVMKCAVGAESIEGIIIEAIQAELKRPAPQPAKPPAVAQPKMAPPPPKAALPAGGALSAEGIRAELKGAGISTKDFCELMDLEVAVFETMSGDLDSKQAETAQAALDLLKGK